MLCFSDTWLKSKDNITVVNGSIQMTMWFKDIDLDLQMSKVFVTVYSEAQAMRMGN